MNNKIDWKKKLSSRKFWALLAALAVAILTGIVKPEVVTQVVSVITAVGACVAYIMAEAKVDAANAGMALPPIDITEDDYGTID